VAQFNAQKVKPIPQHDIVVNLGKKSKIILFIVRNNFIFISCCVKIQYFIFTLLMKRKCFAYYLIPIKLSNL
jgi:hypothetical protein